MEYAWEPTTPQEKTFTTKSPWKFPWLFHGLNKSSHGSTTIPWLRSEICIPPIIHDGILQRHSAGSTDIRLCQLYPVRKSGQENRAALLSRTTRYRGLRTSRYTFAVHATNGKIDRTVLFDRDKDPYEMKNIATERPKLVRALHKQLREWLMQTNDPFAAYLPKKQ